MSDRKGNLKETPHMYSMSGERAAVKYIDNQCLRIAVFTMEDSVGVPTAFFSLFFWDCPLWPCQVCCHLHVGSKQSQCLGPFLWALPAVSEWC